MQAPLRSTGVASPFLFAFALSLGCGDSSRAPFDAADASSDALEIVSDAAVTPGFSKDAEGGGSTPGDCTEASKLVYVVSEANDLFSYAPDKSIFTKVGHLVCPGAGRAHSMSVDRSGTAWVNFTTGSLFKVSTKDASCEATPFVPGQHGFVKFGMAFSANGPNSKDETLYVSSAGDQESAEGLAVVDLATFVLTPVGTFSGRLSTEGCELTGTGDGRLYGFFSTKPAATFAAIDMARGATSLDRTLDGLATGSAWAFSFWGGDFWFYTSVGSTSKVTRLRTSGDGSIATVIPDVGNMHIVGAGVSTCAPTTPPR